MMKVRQLRMNGITNPIGFSLPKLRCSWKVENTRAKKQEWVLIEVSKTESFEGILYKKEGAGLNSASETLDFVCEPCTRYYYKVSVKGENGEKATSEAAFFETGKMEEPWIGKWIKPEKEDTFHPIFVKTFPAGNIKKARLYISGLGLYEVHVNQKKAGEEVLAPLFSDYHTQCQRQTYDITEEISQTNEIKIFLGNGWYKGTYGLEGKKENYGSEFMTIAEIHLEFENGEKQIIGTDETWEYYGSDIESSDIYDGEACNRLLWDGKENPKKKAVFGEPKGKLVERYSLPVKEKEEVPIKEIIHTPARETVLDFGQNFAGYVVFHSRQPKGAEIVLDFGEILQQGNFYNANYRRAESRYTYISGGKEETVKPHFPFFGFRYVRVSGWSGEMKKEDFIGKAVYSDLKQTGWLETGNEKINQLISNCLWGQKSNSIDIPTDCPQRDERLGWTGDVQVFAATACYNMDMAAFYHKFLHDLRTEQEKFNGIIPMVIPTLNPERMSYCSVWGDVATFLPEVLYRYYGDKEALAEYYPVMKGWVDFISGEDEKRGRKYLFDFCEHIGDWLALDGKTSQSMKGGTDDYFIASCYYAKSADNVSKTAAVLGFAEEAEMYRELCLNIKNAVKKEFFSESGRLCVDTQTGYIVALNFGIYVDKETIIEGLKTRLYKDCYKIRGGFVGAPVMCRVLAENGMEEEAFYFLSQEEYPGWIHCIDLGATTCWERWNSVLDDGTISGTLMNSLNHYAFGSVVEYIYRNIAGIKPLEPGFRKASIAPMVFQKLGHMKASYDSAYGSYEAEWELKDDGRIHARIGIPFGCEAIVKLPYNTLPCNILQYYHGEDMVLPSGRYEFEYQPVQECRGLFSKKTFFKEMMQHAQAKFILKEKMPFLYEMLESGNEDFLTENLETIINFRFLGIQESEVKEVAKEILKITA